VGKRRNDAEHFVVIECGEDKNLIQKEVLGLNMANCLTAFILCDMEPHEWPFRWDHNSFFTRIANIGENMVLEGCCAFAIISVAG